MKRLLVAAAAAAALLGSAVSADAQQFFRIGTGGTAGTYYPVGGMIANAISESGGGVKGLSASAVASNGSLANINAIVSGQMESGFAQADVAAWAYSGTGLFEGRPAVTQLRLIANLYPESLHLVVRNDAKIATVADLKGKRVSIDEPGSGTLVDARLVLEAFGLTVRDIRVEHLKPGPAGDKMKDGAVDAFFFVGGYPAGAISELAATGPGVSLAPVAGPQIDKLIAANPFFFKDVIPEGVYKGVAATPTIAVGAQWVTGAAADETLIYNVTKALWSETTRKVLDAGHAKGKLIQPSSALSGAGVPLHPGAARFYREAGLLK